MSDDEPMIQDWPDFIDSLWMTTADAQVLELQIMLGGLSAAGIGGGVYVMLFSGGSAVCTIVGFVSFLFGLGAAIGVLAV